MAVKIGHQLINVLCDYQIKPTYYSQTSRVTGDGSLNNYYDDWQASTRIENDRVANFSKEARCMSCEMAGVVEEVGMGVSQFAKGQSVVWMPSQSEYDLLDCEHGERQRVREDGFTNSNGMPSCSFKD